MDSKPRDESHAASTGSDRRAVFSVADTSAAKDLIGAVLDDARFIALTGKPDAGRSAVVDMVAIGLIDAGIKVIRVRNNVFGPLSVGRLTVLLLGGQHTGGADDALQRVVQLVTHRSHLGKRFVVVIEDADKAEPAALELLKLLPELHREGSPRAQILLVGRPGLWTLLAQRSPPPLTEMPSSGAPRAAIPEPRAAMPEPRAAMPEPRAAMPEPRAAMPEPRAAMPEPTPVMDAHWMIGAAGSPGPQGVGRIAGADGEAWLLSRVTGRRAAWALLAILFAITGIVLVEAQSDSPPPDSVPLEVASRSDEGPPPMRDGVPDGASTSPAPQEPPQTAPSTESAEHEGTGGTPDNQASVALRQNDTDVSSEFGSGATVPPATPPLSISFRGQIRNTPTRRTENLFVVIQPQKSSTAITARFDTGMGLLEPGEFAGNWSDRRRISVHGRLMAGNVAYFCYLSGAIIGDKLVGSVSFVPSSGGRVTRSNFTLIRS